MNLHDNNLNIYNRLTLRDMWDSGYDIALNSGCSTMSLNDMMDIVYISKFENLNSDTVYSEDDCAIVFSIMRGRKHLMQNWDWGFAWEASKKGRPFTCWSLVEAKRVFAQLRVENACITKDVLMIDNCDNLLAVYRYVLN